MYKILLSIVLFSAFNLLAVEFNVDTKKPNSVKFISDAPIEEFTGETGKIDGYLIGEESDLSEDSELYFEVDLNAVTTGVGLRDRHMRENYLETVDYPFASFTGKITEANKTGDNWDVKVSGTFEIHGKKKPMIIEGKMVKKDGGYQVVSNFSVALSNHAIEVPSLMFKKIDENMAVELDFFLKKV